MYWRQNTYKKTLQWTELLDLRDNFTVSKYCCRLNFYFFSLLALDDFDLLNCCRKGCWRTWVSPFTKSELYISVCLNFADFAIQTFSSVFEGFRIYPQNINAFNIFTWGKISCRANSSMNMVQYSSFHDLIFNAIRTYNHLVHKRTLNHLTKLTLKASLTK